MAAFLQGAPCPQRGIAASRIRPLASLSRPQSQPVQAGLAVRWTPVRALAGRRGCFLCKAGPEGGEPTSIKKPALARATREMVKRLYTKELAEVCVLFVIFYLDHARTLLLPYPYNNILDLQRMLRDFKDVGLTRDEARGKSETDMPYP